MMQVEPSTQHLVLAAQAGDEASTEILWQRYLPRVARMVAAQLGMRRDDLPAEVEDLAQEAIVKALRAMPQFEVRGRGAFTAWLATIVLNCVRGRLRDGRRPSELRLWQRYGDLDLSESLFVSGGPTPSRTAVSSEVDRLLERAMLGMPRLFREVLSLRFFADMSHAEIAQTLGRTEVSVRKLLQRALQTLRAELARHGLA